MAFTPTNDSISISENADVSLSISRVIIAPTFRMVLMKEHNEAAYSSSSCCGLSRFTLRLSHQRKIDQLFTYTDTVGAAPTRSTAAMACLFIILPNPNAKFVNLPIV